MRRAAGVATEGDATRTSFVPVALVRRSRGAGGWRGRLEAVVRDLGGSVEVVDDGADPPPGAVLLLTGSPNWYPGTLERLDALGPSGRPRVALWLSEPVPPPRAYGLPRPRLHAREVVKIVLRDPRATDPYTNARRIRYLLDRRLCDLVIATSDDKRDYLVEHGIQAEVAHLGYHADYGTDLGLERDLDVVFVGAVDVPRRRRALKRLHRSGLDVVAVGRWNDPRYWGERRTAFLNRAKIMLNLSRYAGQFSGQRLVLGAATGALVVSEPMPESGPWRCGEHYVAAGLDELPAVARRYLDDEDERRRITAAAHRLVTTELTLERSVIRVLALIEEAGLGG